MNRCMFLGFLLTLKISLLANSNTGKDDLSYEMILKFKQGFSARDVVESNDNFSKYTIKSFLKETKNNINNRQRLLDRMASVDLKNIPVEEYKSICREIEKAPEIEYCSLSTMYKHVQEEVKEISWLKNVRPIPILTKPNAKPDYSDRQDYFKDIDSGINAQYAWDLGILGEDVVFRDVEGSWDHGHEDLGNIIVGLASTSSEWIEHGTNTIGVLMAQHNGFGINGATPNAKLYTYSVYNQDGSNTDPARTFAVAKAIEESNPGDVVILELQDRGCGTAPENYAPADYKIAIWDIVKAATSDSIIVIAAAGNGNQNLDGTCYENYRNRGDNGSIIVGAGHPKDQSKNGSSSYGSPVHLQGWGYYITTTGGSRVKEYRLEGGYTWNYAGTSGATPIVASAVGLVQSWAKKHQNRYLGPYEMRNLLISTGKPFTGDKHIGPLPNVKAAIEKLQGIEPSSSIASNSSAQGLSSAEESSSTTSLVSPKVSLQKSLIAGKLLIFKGKNQATLSVYNSSGKLVRKASLAPNSTLSLDFLNPGNYFLQISNRQQNESLMYRVQQ